MLDKNIIETHKKETILHMWKSINSTKEDIRKNREHFYSEILSLYYKNKFRFETAYRIITFEEFRPSTENTIDLVKNKNINNQLLDYLCDVYIVLNNLVNFDEYMTELVSGGYTYKDILLSDDCPFDKDHTRQILKLDFARLDVLEDYNILPYSMSSYIANGMRFLFYDFYNMEYNPGYL